MAFKKSINARLVQSIVPIYDMEFQDTGQTVDDIADMAKTPYNIQMLGQADHVHGLHIKMPNVHLISHGYYLFHW